ncbi:hypothetical protein [Actinocrispum wychmicini]|uniref:hypothetical protein n=1 Tax=Actinocrispum wychmicini TaxID=1213861 RepID=UPI00104560B0|nr:hypothetical protein [Actinocrispum wychmicini]
MLTLVAATVTQGTASASVADCPAPSWIRVIQSNSNGSFTDQGNQVNSYEPGRTLTISISNPGLRYAAHTGDVKPRTNALFEYFDQFGNREFLHQTQLSRANGVIHHEPEVRSIPFGPGAHLTIYGTYTDECGLGTRTVFLGYMDVVD